MKYCTKCGVHKSKTEFHKNKVKKDGLQTQCKSCKKTVNRRWLINNRDKRRAYKNAYHKRKRQTDDMYRLKDNYRRRTHKAFKAKGWAKTSRTGKMLGTDWDFMSKHIENQFTEGMTWENYGIGGWEIDHIIPLASAKTKEELIKLCHYTNLQPLWQEDNLKKGDKIL